MFFKWTRGNDKRILGRIHTPFEDGDVEDGTGNSQEDVGNANAEKRPAEKMDSIHLPEVLRYSLFEAKKRRRPHQKAGSGNKEATNEHHGCCSGAQIAVHEKTPNWSRNQIGDAHHGHHQANKCGNRPI
jgi:hypothetical protein